MVPPSAGIAAPPPPVVIPPVQEQTNVRTLTTTAPPPRKYTNTVLEVKKLPPSMNNIATLNGYFQRFGKIVNIQVGGFFCVSFLNVHVPSPGSVIFTMDDSSYRRNFTHYHSWREHLKMSKIAKFGCELL
jgi:hypothetical protein